MIDADEQPLRQSDDQTMRIWDRVRMGMAAERRRFRRHALLAAFAGGLIGAALLAASIGAFSGDSEPPQEGPNCPAAEGNTANADCP
jgi:hypothetical protein